MTFLFEELERVIKSKVQESEHLEFKEAKTDFSFEKLLRYCAAIANERGGSLILGVTDKPPLLGQKSFFRVSMS